MIGSTRSGTAGTTSNRARLAQPVGAALERAALGAALEVMLERDDRARGQALAVEALGDQALGLVMIHRRPPPSRARPSSPCGRDASGSSRCRRAPAARRRPPGSDSPNTSISRNGSRCSSETAASAVVQLHARDCGSAVLDGRGSARVQVRLARADRVHRAVARDPEQPARELASRRGSIEEPERPQERLLRDVFGRARGRASGGARTDRRRPGTPARGPRTRRGHPGGRARAFAGRGRAPIRLSRSGRPPM